MMSIEPPMYRYAMNVKLNQIQGQTLVSSVFPSVEDVAFNSRDFEKFEEAVESTNALVAELTKSLNVAVKLDQYVSMSELNPKLTGKETLSKDWALNEMAKVWIIDQIAQKTKPGPIRAVGLAQLMEVQGESVLVN